MFERFSKHNFNRFATRGFCAEGNCRACESAQSASFGEKVNTLILSLDTALAVSIFAALALIIISVIGIIALVSLIALIALAVLVSLITVVIIRRTTQTRPRQVSAN